MKAEQFGGGAVSSAEIAKADQELLVRTNWLNEIVRGWYMLVRPDRISRDTSAWYAHFWDFVHFYLKELYGSGYCLGAENSIDLHVGNPVIPKQVVVIIKKGGSRTVHLLFNTSIFIYDDSKNFPPEMTSIRQLQVMTLPYALCKATPVYFCNNSADAQIAFGLIKNIQELAYVIANYRFVRAGERIIGAFEALKEEEKAEELRQEIKKMGMSLKGTNPFESLPIIENPSFQSPYQGRVMTLWKTLRSVVIDHFPLPPGIEKNKQAYLNNLEELYLKDAYNSLSIEGYRVTPELISRVLNHNWHPDLNLQDEQERDALAARGYYEAFVELKRAIKLILEGAQPGTIIRNELSNWFQKLFSTSVQAGILKPTELLGYRRTQVYIRNSRHIPFPKEALLDSMEAFFDCLEKEPHPAVRAILGHFLFVYIHPFMDGNGRLARFIMNAMLASGGYPWTVLPATHRSQYFETLEKASVEKNILLFTLFVKDVMLS